MGIGISILVFAVGAIFTFLVNATIAGIDIHVVGWLLMAAGAIGLIVEMAVLTPPSSSKKHRGGANPPRPRKLATPWTARTNPRANGARPPATRTKVNIILTHRSDQ